MGGIGAIGRRRNTEDPVSHKATPGQAGDSKDEREPGDQGIRLEEIRKTGDLATDY